jgi:glycosyltransferase involved in cell wall biosynthesis
MVKLVSIIVPCFNAEKWIREAIESCLQQSYPLIEIIVIDDGSTDRSLEIIKSYQGKVIWETGPNRGGNYARNRGFSLSKGEYIQYLDADDYFAPNKIENQVKCLEETKADIVYGDITYQHHLPDGKIVLEPANFFGISGEQSDVLESLLSYGCLPPIAYLFRREIILKSRGWDETLKAGQDRDFLISLLLDKAKIVYQFGFDSVYRRYGNVTVSTTNKRLLVQSFCTVLDKAEKTLISSSQYELNYQTALAYSYYFLLRKYGQNINFFECLLLLKNFLYKSAKIPIKSRKNKDKLIFCLV